MKKKTQGSEASEERVEVKTPTAENSVKTEPSIPRPTPNAESQETSPDANTHSSNSQGATNSENVPPQEEIKEKVEENWNKKALPDFNLSDTLKNATHYIIENWQLLVSELDGSPESALRRKVQQASTLRVKKPQSDGEEVESEPLEETPYSGPTAMVWVKEPKSAWERMR